MNGKIMDFFLLHLIYESYLLAILLIICYIDELICNRNKSIVFLNKYWFNIKTHLFSLDLFLSKSFLSVYSLRKELFGKPIVEISHEKTSIAFVMYTHKIAALTIWSLHTIQCRPKQSTKQCVIAKNTLFLSAQPSLLSSVWPVHNFSSFSSLASLRTSPTIEYVLNCTADYDKQHAFESCVYKNNSSSVKIILFEIFSWWFDVSQNVIETYGLYF